MLMLQWSASRALASDAACIQQRYRWLRCVYTIALALVVNVGGAPPFDVNVKREKRADLWNLRDF